MLIHIGDNEFVDFKHTEMILDLKTIDQESKKKFLSKIPEYQRSSARAAILTTEGKWIASTLSPEALAARGVTHPFTQAVYLKSEWRKSSCYRY